MYGTVVHLVWAATLLITPEAAMATPVAGLAKLFGDWLPLALILSSILSVTGLTSLSGRLQAVALIPQQFILTVSALSAATCVANSAYADGVVRGQGFMLVDQAPAILACLCHLIAVLSGGKRD